MKSSSSLAVNYDQIVQANQRIAPYIHQTAIFTSHSLNQYLNTNIFFKAENLQKIGAFKSRGAINALLQFTEEQKRHGVIAYSSGNHAQGIAYAAKLLNLPAVIVMPEDAPKIKIAATEDYGAEVVLYDRYTQSREEIAQQLAIERQLTILPPFDHPAIIEGQGTCAYEFIHQLEQIKLDMLIAPVGGGGLISGSAIASKHLLPSCNVYGVEPETGNDAQQSLAQGNIIRIDTPKTIADGVQTQRIGELTFPIMQQYVDHIVTATDQTLMDCMNFFATRMKLIVEPTSCLPLAAILEGKIDVKHKNVGIIISGGNIDPKQFCHYLNAAHPIF